MNQINAAIPKADTAPQSTARIEGALSFIAPQDEKPVFHSSALTGSVPKIFFENEEHVVPIGDMREIADELSVDREGFELLRHSTRVSDLYDDDAVENEYNPEIEALLKERFNADQVVVFDVTRRSDGGDGAANPDGLRGPARRVHADYTEKSGPQRVRDILGEAEAQRLFDSGAHIIQVNVWRPIKGPVQRAPLAVVDSTSLLPGDLVATDQVFPDRVGEIYHLAFSPDQRWYFAPEMTPDEVLLLKGWDSIEDGRTRFNAHGAFELTETAKDAPARESIELRTLVIIEND